MIQNITDSKFKKILFNQITINLVLAIVINFIIEVLGRKGIGAGILYMLEQKKVCLYNTAFIFLTLNFALLVKRRVFAVTLISTLWLAIGITNGIMLGYRVTPFTVVDFTLISSAFTVVGKYMSMKQQILLYVAVFAVLAILLFIFLRAPKHKEKIQYRRNILVVTLCVVSFYFITKGALASGVLSRYFGNIALAYQDYGVPYCFTVTFVDRGINKPPDYSEKAVKRAMGKKLKGAKSPITIKKGTKKRTPNIIYVQLESFFDPTLVKGLTFSEDPIPNFRKLKKEYTSGYLSVPVVGAGTCNTEFEVISEMNMDFFGPGEYPYKSIMKETTSESIAYNLKKLGYDTHAIHNNNGNFYGRNRVFSRLGFDTFTSIEYMKNVTMNPIGWANDDVLTEEILKVLDDTKEQDLIYAISVQGHGNYPETVVDENPKITVSGLEVEGRKNAFEYYVNQINEMDQFIADLVEALSNYNEDTVLVLYGDHLPSLDIDEDELKSKSIYRTQYIIWDNFNLPKKNRNLQAYQLSASIFSKLGINEGTLTKYHQKNMGSKKYSKYLRMLQYDMLYGKQYVYGETNPFLRTKIQMGIDDIIVTFVEQDGENLKVHGRNFTKYSGVAIDGKLVDSNFIDEFTMEVPGHLLEKDAKITVKQLGNRKSVLSTSNEYSYFVKEESDQEAQDQD